LVDNLYDLAEVAIAVPEQNSSVFGASRVHYREIAIARDDDAILRKRKGELRLVRCL
jgi:hypothetical protein